MEIEPVNAWDRRLGEREAQHAWLLAYCAMGPQRSLAATSKRVGVSLPTIMKADAANEWQSRAAAYDSAAAVIAEHVVMDDAEALGAQYVAGMAMMRLGITALQSKNPAMIRMKQIESLLQGGSEMMRRGAGVADLKVDHTTTNRIASGLDGLLDLIEGDET